MKEIRKKKIQILKNMIIVLWYTNDYVKNKGTHFYIIWRYFFAREKFQRDVT